MFAIDKIRPIFSNKLNNLIQKKSINFQNTYKGF